MKRPDNTRFHTIKEVAEQLRISEKTVRRWIEADALPAHKFGRQWRISNDDLRAYCALSRKA